MSSGLIADLRYRPRSAVSSQKGPPTTSAVGGGPAVMTRTSTKRLRLARHLLQPPFLRRRKCLRRRTPSTDPLPSKFRSRCHNVPTTKHRERNFEGKGSVEGVVRGVTMYRQQNTALFDSAFVPLGLILRHAHTDECADQSADRAANSQAGQGSHNRAGRNERTEARNRQCADTDQQSQGAAHYAPGSHASGRSLGRLRVLLMSELLRALVVGQEHRNVVVREPRRDDLVDGVFRLSVAFVNSKYRCLFACHV